MTAHDFLTDQGAYTHLHVKAVGDGLRGNATFDLYKSGSHNFIIKRRLIVDQYFTDFNFIIKNGLTTDQPLTDW